MNLLEIKSRCILEVTYCDATKTQPPFLLEALYLAIDIIEKQRGAINELLANIELSHPEEYKQYRELLSVDEAYKLTEE